LVTGCASNAVDGAVDGSVTSDPSDARQISEPDASMTADPSDAGQTSEPDAWMISDPADAGAPADAGSDPDTGAGADPDAGTGRVDECSDAPEAWIFCSGFEEGSFAIWDDYDGNPSETNRLVEDSGPFSLGGNHVAQLVPPAGRSGADLVKVLPSSHDRLYSRWYVKWEPGFDFNARNHGGGLFAGDRTYLGRSGYPPDGTNWFTAWVDYRPGDPILHLYSYYAGMYQQCNPGGECWGDSFPCVSGERYCERPQHLPTTTLPRVEADRWYCIETMADGGTPTSSEAGADGTLNLYIDGAEMGPWDDLWLRSTSSLKVSHLWLSLFHHDAEHADVGLRFDNVVVSTERIGCPGR